MRSGESGKGRKAKVASVAYLEQVGLWYLANYGGTERKVRDALMKRVQRSVDEHGTDAAEGARFVDEVIHKLRGFGYLDDRRFATANSQTLQARGKSRQAVIASLRKKGVGAEVIDEVVDRTAATELEAARIAVRKRNYPPLTGGDRERHKELQRRLARLVRGGFSFDIARQALEEAGVGMAAASWEE